jgi:ubiquinone/menaquinone biosynthesis C-methylase UbiE
MSNELENALEAAWAYEGLHVDALFRQWAEPLLDAAGIAARSRVLDVACGTGASLARTVGQHFPAARLTHYMW